MSATRCRKATWFHIFCLSGFDHMIYPKPCTTFRVIVYILTNKTPIILTCMIGVVAVSYGMLKDNTLIFIIGLFFVFVGYLLIRRKMKEFIRNNP
jgi:hypothetical protein